MANAYEDSYNQQDKEEAERLSDLHEREQRLHGDPSPAILLEVLRDRAAELLEQWAVGIDASMHSICAVRGYVNTGNSRNDAITSDLLTLLCTASDFGNGAIDIEEGVEVQKLVVQLRVGVLQRRVRD